MALGKLDIDFPATVKSYASQVIATEKAKQIAAKCIGTVSVRISPTQTKRGCRYTAYFYAFSDECDICFVAHQGFLVHR